MTNAATPEAPASEAASSNPEASQAPGCPVPDVLLLGDPVAHSKSPSFQNAGFRAIGSAHHYGVRQVDAAGLEQAFDELRSGVLHGFNVTVPHKARALALADEATPIARRTGAANTYWCEDGVVRADNTDVAGVRASVAALGAGPGPAIVLGAGGAAAAAVVALAEDRALTVVNRSEERLTQLLEQLREPRATGMSWMDAIGAEALFAEASVIVNATSLGLSERNAAEAAFGTLPFAKTRAAFLDLSYASEPTAFLALGPADVPKLDGATMLLHQGIAAFERWTGAEAPVPIMRAALAIALERRAGEIG